MIRLRRLLKVCNSSSVSPYKNVLTLIHLDGKELKADVDQMRRLSSSNVIFSDCGASLMSLQETNYGIAFIVGSPHQTHLRTITLLAILTRREPQTGSFKGTFSKPGSHRIHFFGSMENVRFIFLVFFPPDTLTTYCICSWVGQERPLVC